MTALTEYVIVNEASGFTLFERICAYLIGNVG